MKERYYCYIISPNYGLINVNVKNRTSGIIDVLDQNEEKMFEIGMGMTYPIPILSESFSQNYRNLIPYILNILHSMTVTRINDRPSGHREVVHKNSGRDNSSYPLVRSRNRLTFTFPNCDTILNDLLFLETRNNHLKYIVDILEKDLTIKKIQNLRKYNFKLNRIRDVVEFKINTNAKFRAACKHCKHPEINFVLNQMKPEIQTPFFDENIPVSQSLPNIQIEVKKIFPKGIITYIYYNNDSPKPIL